MSFDGIFIHHLRNEISLQIIGKRIQKVIIINDTDFVFQLSKKSQLYMSINGDHPHIRMSSIDFIPSTKTSPLFAALKKYFESAIITACDQVNNDRILIIQAVSRDELGYETKVKLVLEFYGRSANFFITNEENIIIDCYKRSSLSLDENTKQNGEQRLLLPKSIYYPSTTNKIDPFSIRNTNNIILFENQFEGISNLLFSEIQFKNDLNLIHSVVKPTFIMNGKKAFFYAFDLIHLEGERILFDNLSTLLEYYYTIFKHISTKNAEEKLVQNLIEKEIIKNKGKLLKQQEELLLATENLKYEEIGNLLSSNLYLVKKNMTSINVQNFYRENEECTIALNPLRSPSDNLNHVFQKYKKAKRSIDHLEEQIKNTTYDITYWECLLEQLSLSKNSELKEIMEELKIGQKNASKKKNTKPNITVYQDFNHNLIYVGKNNIQNNYLTHTFASNQDYFFHVKGIPGSHTILRTQEITDELIKLTATIASIHSKARLSSNVAVDYTLIKHVKKIPKTKGSFVTYTNFKTVYVNPDMEYISQSTKH